MPLALGFGPPVELVSQQENGALRLCRNARTLTENFAKEERQTHKWPAGGGF